MVEKKICSDNDMKEGEEKKGCKPAKKERREKKEVEEGNKIEERRM